MYRERYPPRRTRGGPGMRPRRPRRVGIRTSWQIVQQEEAVQSQVAVLAGRLRGEQARVAGRPVRPEPRRLLAQGVIRAGGEIPEGGVEDPTEPWYEGNEASEGAIPARLDGVQQQPTANSGRVGVQVNPLADGGRRIPRVHRQ